MEFEIIFKIKHALGVVLPTLPFRRTAGLRAFAIARIATDCPAP